MRGAAKLGTIELPCPNFMATFPGAVFLSRVLAGPKSPLHHTSSHIFACSCLDFAECYFEPSNEPDQLGNVILPAHHLATRPPLIPTSSTHRRLEFRAKTQSVTPTSSHGAGLTIGTVLYAACGMIPELAGARPGGTEGPIDGRAINRLVWSSGQKIIREDETPQQSSRCRLQVID